MVKYSIAICNYNMGDTIGATIDSLLKQVDDRFEIVVVDDGSTDQSPEVLRKKASNVESLRVVELPPCKRRKLGVTRNISVHASDGEYVLLQLDADDEFSEGIIDVIDVFERIEEHIDHEFYLMCCGFGIGKRDFLLNYGPYRNLPVGGEDQDMWRRMLADDSLIRIESENLSNEIGYEKDRTALAKRWFRVAVSNFQTGIDYRSYLEWSYTNRSTLGFLYDFFVCAPLAYVVALTRESYDLPEEFKEKKQSEERIQQETISLVALEERYGFRIDREQLSERAKEIFYLD